MTTPDLKRLLFRPPDGGRRALFASQRELARKVAGLPGSSYDGKEQSLAVFINQILLGRRSCPDELTDGILAVLRTAASEADVDEDRALDLERRARLLLTAASTKTDSVDQLLGRQLKAKEVVIVNPYTLEGRGHPRASEFQEAMLDALLEGEGTYTFVLDEKRDFAREQFWELTRDGLAQYYAASKMPAERETQRASDELDSLRMARRLSIITVEPGSCVVPLVAFDPDRRGFCEIYVWDWWRDRDGEVIDNIARLSPDITHKWLDDFYPIVVRKRQPPSPRGTP